MSKPAGQHTGSRIGQQTGQHTGQHAGQHTGLGRLLSLEIVRVTERAAVAAARLRGRGAEKMSDQAAVDAMRQELSGLAIEGTVVIGEGEMDEAPMLFIGEKVGIGSGPKVDIAVDPLEGTTLCAKNMAGAIATLAMTQDGTLLHAPDIRRGWCSTPSKSASAPRKWASKIHAANIRSRTWSKANACSRRPASPTAACCAACSSAER
jgi:fructose-1,6-bisphosphatase glpX